VTDLPLLSRLLREAFSGEPWHGDSFRDLVIDVPAHLAAARPIPGAHSIWEITLHCDAWLRILRLRLLGAPDEPAPPATDYPPVAETSAAAWQAALENLEEAERRLREMILQQPGGRFDPASREYDGRMHAQLLGGIAHLAHHGGQVTMLRRAMGLPASSLAG
jgi:uncharacterized damage-inducible protein DinB